MTFIGIRLPFLISSPEEPKSQGREIDLPVSLLDVFPTILDWHNASLTNDKQHFNLTGQSILPYLGTIFFSST
jgi:arylsulfatase A-like enzyme